MHFLLSEICQVVFHARVTLLLPSSSKLYDGQRQTTRRGMYTVVAGRRPQSDIAVRRPYLGIVPAVAALTVVLHVDNLYSTHTHCHRDEPNQTACGGGERNCLYIVRTPHRTIRAVLVFGLRSRFGGTFRYTYRITHLWTSL